MTVDLPEAFVGRPITHRALHDISDGRPENSTEAIAAAVAGDYGIEIDLQLSSDGVAICFHDYALDRLTSETGAVGSRTAAELTDIVLTGGHAGIPTLADVLKQVAGRVPLLIEIKDQDGALGPNVGPLERAVADDLKDYEGPVAVMSFNPHSMAAMKEYAPRVPRGLVTDPFNADVWPIPEERLAEVRDIPDFDRVGASFISHNVKDLASPHVARLKARGVPILCWTVRSPEVEAEARKIVDNVTFEGYLPG